MGKHSYKKGDRRDNRLRCIPGRVGSSPSRPEHRRLVVDRGSRMHINCLELLTATLATQTFLKNKISLSVLLRIDNTSAVAYINNLGGTVSRDLLNLAKNLWMFGV